MSEDTSELNISSIDEKKDNDTIEEKQILLAHMKYIENFINNQIYQTAYYYTKLLKQINYREIKEFYFCKNCKKSTIFYIEPKDLLTLEKIYCSCDCSENKKEVLFSQIGALKKYKINEINKYLICQKPECKASYVYFNIDEKENFCKNHVDKNLNVNELNKFVEPSIYNQLLYILLFIVDEQNQNKNNKSDNKPIAEQVKEIRLKSLKDIITTTMINYLKFPNVNLYITIKNFYDSFCKYSESLEENNEKLNFKKIIEIIRNKRKLIHLEKKLYPLVRKLELRQLKLFDGENYNIFNIINNLENLIELDLSENCMYSIESLINAKFKNLKILNIRMNYLNDGNIKHFEKLNFKELISLNLEYNSFTQYELLVVIFTNFKRLEELKIGFNIFKEGKGKDNQNKRKTLKEILDELKLIDNNNIKKFCANNGVFNQITAKNIIPALNLKKCDYLDISYNNLENLDFIPDFMKNEKIKIIKEGNFFKKVNLDDYRFFLDSEIFLK